MSVIDEIRELEGRRIEAINRQDLEALRGVLADNYRHCHANAVVQNVDEVIANIVNNPRRIEPREPDIRVYADCAVLTGEMHNVREQRDGGMVKTTMWVTQVAERRAGSWRFVWFQATRATD